MKKTNKLPMETILVATGDQALPTGVFTTSGTAVNLASGQIGILSWDKNSAVKAVGAYLASGDDSNEVQAIKIVQGTPVSGNTQLADVWEVGDKTHVESGIIRKGNISSVMVKKAAIPVFGGFAATSFTTPVNDGEYQVFLKLDSVRYDREYSTMNDNIVVATAPIVNFTTAGIAQPLDYVLTNIAVSLNSRSKAVATQTRKGNKSFVVFGVKVAGGSGQVIGTITPTTNITFQTSNGTAQILKSSSELCQTLARLVKDNTQLLATSTIENVDITTAGAAAKIDALIVIGLPHETAAYYDNVEQIQVKPTLNFAKSFLTGVDPTLTPCYPNEGTGQGRKWSLLNAKRPLLQVHTMQNMPHGDWFSEGKSYINESNLYTSYIIDYFDTESVLNANVVSPKKTTILFRCEVPSSFTTTVNNIIARGTTDIPTVTSSDAGTGTASATAVAAIEAVLTAWLEHARTTGTNFQVGGDAVAGSTYLS